MRAKHPDWTDEAIRQAVREAFLSARGNLFLMLTRRLNTLGVAYMVSGSVAVIAYGEPRRMMWT